jgi:hypothetical protein
VRPPHGRAPALTRPTATVRLLRSVLLLTVLVLALAAGGCGASEDEVPEVPGSPVELTVPHQRGATDLSEDASATPTPTGTADATETPAATADEGTTGSTGTTGTGGTDAAATPAPAAQDSPATDTAPPEGSAPEKFEQFCQENAGAC